VEKDDIVSDLSNMKENNLILKNKIHREREI